jgi:uncharacterized protein YndB with AHSA1/START domain
MERAHFTIERSYNAAPAEVFAVWSSAKAKWRWFAGPEDWEIEPFELDFRVGGRERSRGPKGGPVNSAGLAGTSPHGDPGTPTSAVHSARSGFYADLQGI